MIEFFISILEYNDYLYSCPRLTTDADEDSNGPDDDEDSNDENNWRNDYPDEDEFDDDNESINERQMRRAMETFGVDNELSSDDDDYYGKEDDFVHSVDIDSYNDDVNRYGKAYAKYKQRLMKENYENGDDDSDSYHSD